MEEQKILIVDDEPLTCKLISTMLKLQGYESASLTDPNLIWETLAAENPTLVIMDYHLGTTDGVDILIEMKQRKAMQSIPVVMTSGLDCEEEVLAAGAKAFLVKPFDWQQLTSIISGIIS